MNRGQENMNATIVAMRRDKVNTASIARCCPGRGRWSSLRRQSRLSACAMSLTGIPNHQVIKFQVMAAAKTGQYYVDGNKVLRARFWLWY
jgi:hypothetical protein